MDHKTKIKLGAYLRKEHFVLYGIIGLDLGNSPQLHVLKKVVYGNSESKYLSFNLLLVSS